MFPITTDEIAFFVGEEFALQTTLVHALVVEAEADHLSRVPNAKPERQKTRDSRKDGKTLSSCPSSLIQIR